MARDGLRQQPEALRRLGIRAGPTSTSPVSRTTSAGHYCTTMRVDDNWDGSLWDPVTGGTQHVQLECPITRARVLLPAPTTRWATRAQYHIGHHHRPNYSASHAAWSVSGCLHQPGDQGTPAVPLTTRSSLPGATLPRSTSTSRVSWLRRASPDGRRCGQDNLLRWRG